MKNITQEDTVCSI